MSILVIVWALCSSFVAGYIANAIQGNMYEPNETGKIEWGGLALAVVVAPFVLVVVAVEEVNDRFFE